jgi:hypothetical protein
MHLSLMVLLLVVAVPACIGAFFLLRPLFRRTVARTPLLLTGVVLLVVCAGMLAAYVLTKYTTEPRAVLIEHATVSDPTGAPSTNYQHAWTDKYPPKTGAFPEWVARKELAQPSFETLPVAGMSFSFAKADAQDRLAGFSDFQATKEEALAQAWLCLKTRIDGRVLARCALLKSREFAPRSTSLGTRIREGIDRELDTRRANLSLAVFEDEVDVANLGNVYRAALCLSATGPSVDAIAAAVIQTADDEAQRMQKEADRVRAERLQNTTRWAYCIGGALFLLLIVTSVYLFLNAHTKGYYAWSLRIIACAIYVAAVGAFVIFFKSLAGI